MNLSEYRASARKDLKGNWNWAAGLILIAVVISLVVAWLASELGSVLLDLLLIGISFTLLDLVDNNYKEENYFTAVFAIFTRDRILPVFITWLLSYVFIVLWSLLLIVPGIIKSLSYSQAEFIVKDMTDAGQEVAATEAINKSRELMNGHKWEYFLLELSFIGWDLLGCLSLGIGFLWILPYIKATEAEYYRKLTGDQSKTELVNKGTQKIDQATSFGN